MRLDTLFPEAIVCDRGFLLARHCRGFSQIAKDWCQFFNVDYIFEASDMAGVRAALAVRSEARRESEWAQFVAMKSTSFAAGVFESPNAYYSTLLEASKLGSLGVRATLLAVTGSLTVSYCKSRFCCCGEKFTFHHFLSCGFLGPDRSPSLWLAIECQDWREAALLILSQFEVFVHAYRGGELYPEEIELFSSLAEISEEVAS
jgi:hypothetical protein